MTHKEAIKLIQGIKEDGWNVTSDDVKALDLAITALQEFDRMKLICANEGIIVYRIKENQE